VLFQRFQGLPHAAFAAFGISDREERRRAILAQFHPSLQLLAEDLLERLGPLASAPLHVHLPRLDWPPGYQPFCTWLTLSHEVHGYQAGPQLGIGVHADHVSIRLGWDTAATAFARFELLARHGQIGRQLTQLATAQDLRFRVFAPVPWPRGSTCVFDSAADLPGSFDEVRRRGVWWEAARAHALPERIDHVASPELGAEATRVLGSLLPLYERLTAGR
jgi:hypothetical protein